MSLPIRRHKRVKDDIVSIYTYVHQQRDRPGVGRYWNSPDPRLDAMKATTVTPYRNYLIFFRALPDRIEVFRVVHAARDLRRLMLEWENDRAD